MNALINFVAHEVVDNIDLTEIRPSSIHGNGLFATCAISAGTRLAVLDGQVVNYEFYYRVKDRLSLPKSVDDYLFMEWNALPEDKLLCRMFRTKYSYINHSRQPNCKLLGIGGGAGIEIWSYFDVNAGDELTLDYREEKLPSSYLSGHGSTYL